eukprot:scaffold241819_cov39-Prasinocladus_malaysianus.AAC.1
MEQIEATLIGLADSGSSAGGSPSHPAACRTVDENGEPPFQGNIRIVSREEAPSYMWRPFVEHGYLVGELARVFKMDAYGVPGCVSTVACDFTCPRTVAGLRQTRES